MAASPRQSVVLEVAAGERTLRGEVCAVDGGYEPSIDGDVLGGHSAYEAAVAAMALLLRARLPAVAPESWSVIVRSDPSTLVAEFAPEGLRALSPERDDCVQRVLSYCPYATISDALEAGSQLLTHCYEPSELRADLPRAARQVRPQED